MPLVSSTIRQRFDAKVDRNGPGGCWLWTASSRGVGYGAIRDGNFVKDAHRVSYELHHGDIPSDKQVQHTCDRKLCVNPRHLRLGTVQENHMDAIKRGLIKPFSKKTRTKPLTGKQIRQIRRDYAGGVSKKVICEKYRLANRSLNRLLGEL